MQEQAVQEQPEGRPGTGSAVAVIAPRWGRWGSALPGFLMASPLSVGIELRPPGVDPRWVRIWVLDRSAATARCQLVARSAAVQSARELQVASGAGDAWWVRGSETIRKFQ